MMATAGTDLAFGIQECSKCGYKLRCEECTYNEKDIKRIMAETQKDAAPLAINRFINQLHIDGVVKDGSELYDELLEVKRFVLKRYYGVEVE